MSVNSANYYEHNGPPPLKKPATQPPPIPGVSTSDGNHNNSANYYENNSGNGPRATIPKGPGLNELF